MDANNEDKSLFNLPKEILIKLISTIREDTKRDFMLELKDSQRKVNAYESHYGHSVLVECGYKKRTCQSGKYVHVDDERCQECRSLCCGNHTYEIRNRYRRLNATVCKECYYEYNIKNNLLD